MSYSSIRRVSIPTALRVSGDTIAAWARPSLIGISRQLYRDSAIYRGIVDRIAEAVGCGWSLQSRDPGADDREAALRGWASACGSAGESLDDIARTLAREWVLTGEAIAAWTTLGAQVVESEMIDEVERDAGGGVTAVTVAGYARGETRRVPADALAWVIDTDQPSARRGIPLLQAAFPVIQHVQDVLDSEARAWRLQSKIVATVLSSDPGSPMGDVDSDDIEVLEDDVSMVWQARPGDSLNIVDRAIPGRSMPDGLRMYLRVIGQAIGLPLEVVLLDWTQSNFSQSRAALAAANAWFGRRRARFARMLERIVGWAFPGRWEAIAPALPWADPQAEAEVAAQRLDRGLSAYSDEIRRLGGDPDEVRARVARDIEQAITMAREIEARTGERVPWERLAGYAPGKTMLAAREAARGAEDIT